MIRPRTIMVGLMLLFTDHSLKASEEKLAQTNLGSQQLFQFKHGINEFKNIYYQTHEKDFLQLIEKGQTPKILFISCSDSRFIPELLLGAKPGDLFVIRTAGNFVPPYSTEIQWDGVAATIQYAVEVLNIQHIIICGHSNCGAIGALYQKLDPQKLNLIEKWLFMGQQAKEMAIKINSTEHYSDKDLLTLTEELSILFQIEHLLSYPFVKKRWDDKTIQIHGWYWDMKTGKILYYNPEENKFIPL